MKRVIENLAALIKVKTILTFLVVTVFVYLAVTGTIDPQSVMQVVTMVIAFYFGSKSEE